MKIKIIYLAVSLFTASSITAYAQLLAGDIVGIDFGPTGPTNNYNAFATTFSNNQGNVDGSLSSLQTLAGSTRNVGFTLSGAGDGGSGDEFSNNDGTDQDIANYPTFLQVTTSNTTDFFGESGGGNSYTFTFSKLNGELTYNFYGISSFNNGASYSVIYNSGSLSATAISSSNGGGTLATLSGLMADTLGNLSITVSNPTSSVSFTNAIALQAVPEPSTWITGAFLCGICGWCGYSNHPARQRRRSVV